MTEWIVSHWGEAAALAAVAIPTLIQVSPIKVNPWTALAKWLGRTINGEISAKVDKMQESLDRHISRDEERFVKQCRMRILRFNDEILQGELHTKEHFDEILDDVTEYIRYCRAHPNYENSKAEMAISNVENTYQKCLAEKSFL